MGAAIARAKDNDDDDDIMLFCLSCLLKYVCICINKRVKRCVCKVTKNQR